MPESAKPQHGREQPIDALVDRYLDGELQPQDSRAMFDALDRDPRRARELYAMQRMIQELGEPVRGHDFSKSILARVHGRKPLLERSGMRLVTAGRIAAGVAVLVSAAAVFALVRFVPGVQTPGVAPRQDIGNLANAICQETPAALTQIQADLSAQVVAPVSIATVEPPAGAEIAVGVVVYAQAFEGEAFALTSADVVDATTPERDPLITGALCCSGDFAVAGLFPPLVGEGAVGAEVGTSYFMGMAPSDPYMPVRFGPDGLPVRAAGLGVEDLFILPSMEGRFVAPDQPERAEPVRRGRAKRK